MKHKRDHTKGSYVSKTVRTLAAQILIPEQEFTPIGQKRSAAMVAIAARVYNQRCKVYIPKKELENLTWYWPS